MSSADRDMQATPLRFAVGDRVACATGEGWLEGAVIGLHYREPEWPDGETAPYQVRG